MSLMLTANTQLVAAVLRGAEGGEESSVLGAIAATRSLVVVVDDILHSLVHRARAEGHTWAEVGEVLHVSRQAAFQRFGGSGPVRAAEVTVTAPLPHAADRALAVLDDFATERWKDLYDRFSARMRAAVPEEVSRSARARIEQNWGEFLGFGAPVVTVRDGLTFVDVPISLERGELNGRVAFNADGEVAGLLASPSDDT